MELLATIVIVGLLIAILLPVMRRTRENASAAMCVNNLRQIGIAITMYVDDHDFKFPLPSFDGTNWYQYIDPYVDDREVFNCPSYKYHTYGSTNYFSYGYNFTAFARRAVMGGGPVGGRDTSAVDLNEIISPSQCIMVVDGRNMEESWATVTIRDRRKGDEYFNRHFGGSNIVFVDGHVKWHRVSDIPKKNDQDARFWWNN